MLISNSHRLLFVHIPKTGGIAIAKALEPVASTIPRVGMRRLLSHLPVREDAGQVAFPLHVTAAWARLKLPPEVFAGYRKFAVVRNPYDRAVSYYHFVAQNPNHHRYAKVSRMSFKGFLEYMARKQIMSDDRQVSMVCDTSGRILVDRVLRYENLAAEFDRLCDDYGLADVNRLERHNASRRQRYEDYYWDPRCRHLVEEIFDDDFRAFGYAKSLNETNNPLSETAAPLSEFAFTPSLQALSEAFVWREAPVGR